LSPRRDTANLAGMKLFKWIAISIVVVVGLIYLTLMVGRIFTPALQDADLAVTRKIVAEGDNGFTHLQTAAAQLWWPEDQQEQLNDLARGTNWNAELAATVLASNAAAFAAIDMALSSLDFQIPEHQLHDDIAYLSDWKTLANLAAVRIFVDIKSGKERDAFTRTVDLIRLANRMQEGNGSIIHYLVGTAIKRLALQNTRTLTPSAQLRSDELTEVTAQIFQTARNTGAMTNALKVEYQMQKIATINLLDRTINTNNLLRGAVRLTPFFNVRKTQNKYAKTTWTVMFHLSQPYAHGAASLTNLAELPGKIQIALGGNAIGEVLHSMSAMTLDRMVRNRVSEYLEIEVTATFLALKAYQLKHGRLPAELSELVPQFLSAVPRDDFDGQPLRYDRDRKILYSVSTNCQDDGGVQKDSRKPEPDWVFPIPF
jgi:hypothetical protein